ncbi:MAG: tetratricopeptide repeat protein [Bacteroidales bacterium]|jgi:tetratricopeptide (TPR) repeat protein|nr:tetratricopeptide repeat protein [Bacteroidales bacterium]
MKKISSYFILIMAVVLMSGCSGLNKMKKNAGLVKYEVTPQVLQTDAGIVPVTIKGMFPAKYFDKKTTLTATPVLTYEGGETPYDKVQVVQGESVQANNTVINYNGGDFLYNSQIPYKDAMKVSKLVLRVKASRGKKTLDFDPVPLADGVIATSTLVMKHGKTVTMKDNFQRIIPESQMADINYVINRSDIRPTELKAEDIIALKDYIKAVSTDAGRQLKSAQVSSYASPDGKITLNEKLSGNRGTSADKFIQKEFAKIEAAKAQGFFDSKTTAEDWEGFRAEVEKSNIQDKDLILRVLSMYSDPDVREKEIRNMSSAFESLKTDILPKLRRSKMIINVDKIGRTDEQILAQAKSDPKVLSLEEMLYAATLTTDAGEKLAFYSAAAEAYPKCIRAHNNVGVVLLSQGKADEAIAAFDKAKAIDNNDVVKNNLGAAYMAKGDLAKAAELYKSMATATAESKFGLGVIAITEGKYDEAVNLLGTEPCFNVALAHLLKKDVNKAKSVLDSMKEMCKCGSPSYLKAVVGARLDDRTYMLNGLREAVGFDAKWKAYAKTDLELAKYWNDDTFKSAVQ